MKWSFANVGLIIFGLIGVFAIVFFTELTVSNEWIGPQFPDYHNRTTFRFNEVPDSTFCSRLDSLCNVSPWRFRDGKWRYFYPEHDSVYNEHMIMLGLPEDLVPSVGEYYEIVIPRDSLEWTMDSWCD